MRIKLKDMKYTLDDWQKRIRLALFNFKKLQTPVVFSVFIRIFGLTVYYCTHNNPITFIIYGFKKNSEFCPHSARIIYGFFMGMKNP